MRLRSLLFVPGDRPDRMEKALSLDADALILDLEDAVAPAAKTAARECVVQVLSMARTHGKTLFVRVNPLDGAQLAEDLAAVLPANPNGIVLPKTEGAGTLDALGELAGELPPVLALANETAAGPFAISTLAARAAMLCGVTWGAEDLATAIGAKRNRDDAGEFTGPLALARNLTLYAAHACGVTAIETVFPDVRDTEGLGRQAATAARDGFGGMLAIHPSQIGPINMAFTPDADEVAHAREIVAAFAAHPDAGVLQISGRMIDAPHLTMAKAVLARAEKIKDE